MIPLLSRGRGRAVVVSPSDRLTKREVTRGQEVKLVCQAEGGHSGPDAAGADGGGIVGKGLLNVPGERLVAGGAVPGEYTQRTGVRGQGCGLEGL